MLTTIYNTQVTNKEDITRWTDSYFTNTRDCVKADGETLVTYAVFVRTPTMFAPEMAVGWLKEVAKKQGFDIKIESPYTPGDLVPSAQPQLFITAPMSKMAECETIFLQKVGAVGVAALNAYESCKELPDAPFIAMGARHCSGTEMQEMMDYAASVGSDAAKARHNAVGFINGASNATAHFFGKDKGAGTMPHALVGYYGSTLKAAQAFRREHSEKPFTVLPDYFGQEVSDSIAVAKAFPEEAKSGELSFRIDTNGGRYMEGLDEEKSKAIIREFAPQIDLDSCTEKEADILYGKGVSVANIFHFKNEMANAGFPNVGVVGSSGFGKQKCKIMADAGAPLSAVGTGSYIPKDFHATYATADIFRYGDDYSVKVGREYLADQYQSSPKRTL